MWGDQFWGQCSVPGERLEHGRGCWQKRWQETEDGDMYLRYKWVCKNLGGEGEEDIQEPSEFMPSLFLDGGLEVKGQMEGFCIWF